MRDALRQAERTLVTHGYEERVLAARHDVQRVMGDALSEVVERHSKRKLVAFMSANHFDPDVAAEVFVLAPR